MKEKKDERIHISLTRREKESLDRYCRILHFSRSQLFRFWLNGKQPVCPVSDEIESRVDELIQIGMQIRQLAQTADRQGFLQEEDFMKFLVLADEIRRLRQTILLKLSEPIRFRPEAAGGES